MTERPFLFIKTGVLCAEPLGFFDELAERYEADLHVTDDINLELHDGRFDRSRGGRLKVRKEVERRVRVTLGEGDNAVYDGFLNTFKRREEVRQEVAAVSGAHTVLLCVRAPLELIKSRIYERHAKNQLSVPSALVPNVEDTIGVAEDMWRHVQWPRISEEPHANLNGAMSIGHLLSRVDEHLVLEHAIEH